MSETVRRLANNATYSTLQSKLDSLKITYNVNSCSSNLSRLTELADLTAQVQEQLFTAMNRTASDGGTYVGYDTLRSRLWPWYGSYYPYPYRSANLDLLQENMDKDRKIATLNASFDSEVTKLESDLRETKDELNTTLDKLNLSEAELEATKVESSGTMLASEEEIVNLRSDLRLAREEARKYKMQVDVLGDYERQVRCLQDEIAILRGERTTLQDRLSRRARSTSPVRRARSPSPTRSSRMPEAPCVSPTRANLTNSIRHSRLVARYNDLYAVDRMDMQDRLRRFVDDDEMVKRIIFIAVCESFHAAKMAFRSFRLRARKLLAGIHTGPGELEDAVGDYICRNLDLYDVETSVASVIRSMNVNPKISFPPECDFSLVSPFIRQACKIAFEMQALEPPLDLSLATDGELFSDSKYRRSYDSEYTAPLVAYHIWPTLVERDIPLIKGECCTRRGASLSPRRSRSPSPLRTSSRLNRSSLSPDRGRSSSRRRY